MTPSTQKENDRTTCLPEPSRQSGSQPFNSQPNKPWHLKSRWTSPFVVSITTHQVVSDKDIEAGQKYRQRLVT